MTSGPEGTDAPAVLARLEDEAAALVATGWGEVDPAVKLEAVGRVQAIAAMLASVTVAIAGDLDGGNATATIGWASTKDFLTAATGGHKGAGPGLVRLARRLRGLPATAAELRAGRLSQAKAEVIAAKVASLPRSEALRTQAEAILLERAEVLDATDLARGWPAVLEVIDPDGTLLGAEDDLDRQDRIAHRERRGSFGVTRGGIAWFKVQSTREDIAVVRETLMPLTAPETSDPGACGGSATAGGSCLDYDCRHDGTDPRDHGARMADALVEACRRLQTANVLPTDHGGTPRIIVTTDLDKLRDGVEAHYGGAFLDGERLSVAAVRRLACDADLIPVVLGGGSLILDEGRAKRLVTAALWIALVLRDRHCAFPGCRRHPIACDAHHVVHWADGGPTNLANLVLVCRRHHTMLHTTPWQVRINPADGKPEFQAPPGRDGPRDWIRERPPHLLVA